MERLIKNKKTIVMITALIILSAVTVALLAPSIYVSRYAYPWGDDFGYGCDPRAVFLRTGSVIAAVAEAIKISYYTWFDWQGTYSSCFMMALQPAVWNMEMYHLTGIIMLATLLLSYLVFGQLLLHRKLGISSAASAFIALLVYLASVEMIPGPAEGFNWYNSAVHYTFMHSWLVIMIALLSLVSAEKTKKNTVMIVVLCVLALFVAGGNNVTTLSGVLLLFLIEGFAFCFGVIGKVDSGKQYALRILPVTITFLAGFLLNVLSLGNRRRMEESGLTGSIDTVRVILRAFAVSVRYLINSFSWELFAVILIVSAVVFEAFAGDGLACKFNFSFPMPLLVIMASYGLLSAMFCPMLLLAQDEYDFRRVYLKAIDMIRTENIVYFSMVLLIVFDVIYVLGWICQKDLLKQIPAVIVCVMAVAGIVVIILSCKTKIENHSKKYLTLVAVEDIMDQTALYYGYQMEENTKRLLGKEQDVIVMPIAVDPGSLYPFDASDWKEGAKLFYNKNSVEYESEPYVFTR